jgi:DNA-binding transcriptional regulator LsrR (DeoR family)
VEKALAKAPEVVPETSVDRLRGRAVWLYFVENRTQNEIAQLLGINRVAVIRLLADARRRNEVRITVSAPLAELAGVEREVEGRFGIARVIAAPWADADADPMRVIAAAAGAFVTGAVQSGMSVGVGWGRTLHATLAFIEGRTLDDFRVVSLLGGIAAARRFNPAEFAWQFAELFQGEGFLIPAPALVDSPETKHALLERCGLSAVFELADRLDMVLLSAGGVEALTTSYRFGHFTEAERRALANAGAAGDVLYHFIDEHGRVVDERIDARVIAVDLDRLRRVPQRVLISGGPEKVRVLRGAIKALAPTVLVTDEVTARALLDG